MIHRGLRKLVSVFEGGVHKTKNEYPLVRKIIGALYPQNFAAVDIKAISGGEQGYSFFVENSTSNQSLVFKIERPFTIPANEEERKLYLARRQSGFAFLDFFHNYLQVNPHCKVAVPQMMRNNQGELLSNLSAIVKNPANNDMPFDLCNQNATLRSALPGSAAEKQNRNSNLFACDDDYRNEDVVNAVRAIAYLHTSSKGFLHLEQAQSLERKVLRPYEEVIADFNNFFQVDCTKISDDEIDGVIKTLQQKIFNFIVENAIQDLIVMLGERSAEENRKSRQDFQKEVERIKSSGVDVAKKLRELELQINNFYHKNIAKLSSEKISQISYEWQDASRGLVPLIFEKLRFNILTDDEARLEKKVSQIIQLIDFVAPDWVNKKIIARDFLKIIREIAPYNASSINALPQAILHGDCNITNFVFDSANQTTGVLDLDNICVGPRILDLMSWHICNRDNVYKSSAEALRAYDAICHLEAEEREAMLIIRSAFAIDEAACALKEVSDFVRFSKINCADKLPSYPLQSQYQKLFGACYPKEVEKNLRGLLRDIPQSAIDVTSSAALVSEQNISVRI